MPTKKSTAKKGKFSTLLNKLNPNSPKKKLLLFVVVFGLIAGGFYAYRSFAAPGMVIINADKMINGVPRTTQVNGKNVLYERGIYGKRLEDRKVDAAVPLPKGSYRVCVNVRNEAWKGFAELRFTPIKIKNKNTYWYFRDNPKIEVRAGFSGWIDSGIIVSHEANWFVIDDGRNIPSTVQFIGIRQVAYVQNEGKCPGYKHTMPVRRR